MHSEINLLWKKLFTMFLNDACNHTRAEMPLKICVLKISAAGSSEVVIILWIIATELAFKANKDEYSAGGTLSHEKGSTAHIYIFFTLYTTASLKVILLLCY